jgi:hypothetical protein
MAEPARLRLQPSDFVEKPAGGQHSPLIAALCDMLPAPGSSWPQAERKAWIEMMEKAFTVTYGVPPGGASSPAPRAPIAVAPTSTASKRRPKAPPLRIEPAFYIDKQGMARKRGGERVMPAEVAGILVDQRGMTGDLGTITWSDDSQGIPKGLQLDISVADVDQ